MLKSPSASPSRRLARLILFLLLLPAIGCQYGLLGKKGAPVVSHLDATVGASVGKVVTEVDTAESKVLKTIADTREEILHFLDSNTEKEAHDLSIGILKGTIGYLDDPVSRNNLAALLKSLIDNTAGPAKDQLIDLRNQLLDREATKKLRYLLQGIMQDLVLDPAANLVNLAIGPKTKVKLQGMLQMLIPAVLNDTAIIQIGKLRRTLLGADMKSDIAGLVDTVLLTANYRLNNPLDTTIHKILKKDADQISATAWSIFTGVILLVIIIGLVIFWLMRQNVILHQRMLSVVSQEIEKYNKPDSATDSKFYNNLTDSIEDQMKSHDLESHMYKFLKDRRIS